MALVGVLLALPVAAEEAKQYRVSSEILHLGQVLAAPVLLVPPDEAVAASHLVPGESQWRYVVKVSPATDDQVHVSLEFSSGNLQVQPNFLVELGSAFSASVDNKVLLRLQVDEVNECQSGATECKSL